MPAPPNRATSSMPNTGSWRHPAMDTIVQRTRQKGSAEINHRNLAKNLFALLSTYVFTWLFHAWFTRTKSPVYGQSQERHPAWDDIIYYGGYLINILRILLVYNILESIYRLTRKEPDFSDLALTPIQRKLLGLNPNVPSNAPSDGIITPPRYPKSSPSATPTGNDRSSSPSRSTMSAASTYSSLLRASSPVRRSSFSATEGPMTPSPLRSTIRGGTMGQSLGFSVQSGSTASLHNGGVFDSPSPPNRTGQGLALGYGNATGVGGSGLPLGNRWVYEKMGRKGEASRLAGRNSVMSPWKA